MADHAFNIEEMLASEGVRANVQPVLTTRRIVTLRIHVEQAIEHINNYHILNFIPATLYKNGIIDIFLCAPC